MFHFLVSAHAPFHEVSNPKFGLGGYLPLLFYLCVLTSLLLCLRLPSYREDSIQNIVLVYRVPSNFLFSLSRVLAPVLLVCGVLMVFSLAYQAFATIDLGIEPRIVEPFEAWSLAFVLTNLTIAIFFWTSLGNLVAQIFRSNVTGFLVTATLLIVQAFASLMLPSNVASFTFGYSAADLYVSEITPDDWGITRLIYWFSVLGLSFAWIFATSIVLARVDPAKRSSYRAFVVILISISLVGQGSVHTHILKVANERQSWTHAYETATPYSRSRLQ